MQQTLWIFRWKLFLFVWWFFDGLFCQPQHDECGRGFQIESLNKLNFESDFCLTMRFQLMLTKKLKLMWLRLYFYTSSLVSICRGECSVSWTKKIANEIPFKIRLNRTSSLKHCIEHRNLTHKIMLKERGKILKKYLSLFYAYSIKISLRVRLDAK